MNVLELFAGVGGFRVGLEKASPRFKTLWSNQFEPSIKSQDAFEVYNYHFPDSENWNEDITTIPNERFSALKGKVDLIVGGFPCQDYSVARTKKDERGIEGKKGSSLLGDCKNHKTKQSQVFTPRKRRSFIKSSFKATR